MTNALTLKNNLGLVSLGNIESYISATNSISMLTLEEEQDCAWRLKLNNDLEAASRLILSHLRFVVSVARQYLGYGLSHSDLIQEGNVGLMKAVKRFDPSQGIRLVSYAVHWIKAEIHEFIIKNWRVVKIATTKAQRKLFFNLRSLKNSIKENYLETENLTEKQIKNISEHLDVKREEVISMEARLNNQDIALENSPDDENDKNFTPIAYLTDESQEPSKILEAKQTKKIVNENLKLALDCLDDRSKEIIQKRWLNSEKSITLQELADKYKISAERVRQIEVSAMKKMKKFLENIL